MLIDISLMKGETPRLKPHLLADEAATLAKDCQFERGILAPVTDNLVSFSTPISPLTLFKYNEHWLCWAGKTHAIHNPMAQDSYDRVYWTGEEKPRVTAQDIALDGNGYGPTAWYDLGVPVPASAPIVTDVDTSTGEDPEAGELDSYDDEDRVYVQTYVTRFGEEGAPGDPSNTVVIEKPGSTVSITLAQPGENTHNITHTRLYRSVTSTTGSEYIQVAELPISQETYQDSERDASGATLETYDYDVPDENMQGLCQMANGICAGFAGNEVMFSEAYLPYAWPSGYRGTTEHEIMAIAAIGNSLAVATKGYPYVFSGVTPSAITGTKLNAEQACVSAESLVVLSGMAFYASPDGLIAISSDGATNVTDQLITRDQWQAFNPSTIKATSVEGKYIAQYDGGAFIFDPVSRDFIRSTDSWDCACNDLETDTLYVAVGSEVSQWRGGSTPLMFEWQSKEFLLPMNSVMSSARIQSPNPELLAVDFFAGGELVMSLGVGELTHEAFRLPSVRAFKWQIKVSGSAEVERILVASSMQELS
ncbi:hypothetical protein CSW98_01580 [Vibrio sp. HA2012]|uniref:hypothetical protein n=1 Tax=Vibrio sp. HA2012 TaxID=1971595 RepID=UPI000C2BB7BB|nr:hypothetical protein [Vibrio sp. HA2012]PJC88299.1 hypothetical protein CSW98_01580 [Vibrio sp. HA2012]